MDYELALELKNAGFPQGEVLSCKCAFLTNDEKGEADEVYDCNTDRVYAPTLEELVAACGDDCYNLQRWGDGRQAALITNLVVPAQHPPSL